jgi:hypothetical protein
MVSMGAVRLFVCNISLKTLVTYPTIKLNTIRQLTVDKFIVWITINFFYVNVIDKKILMY